MPSNIWTQCGARTNLRPLETTAWRIVEAQHRISTQKLVNSVDDQVLLDELLEDRAKPPRITGPGTGNLHWLLHTPFRYPPLRHGSRFGTRRERGIWYGAERLETTLAEAAYYRWVFLSGTTADLTPLMSHHTAFLADIATDSAVDLHDEAFAPFRDEICSPCRYETSQTLGAMMRADGAVAFRCPSARDPQRGPNIGLFHPSAFRRNAPRDEQTWYGHATEDRVIFSCVMTTRPIEFLRADFLVEGRLPHPAVG